MRASESNSTRRAMRYLWPFIAKRKRALLTSLAGVALYTTLSVLPPLLLRYLIDDVIRAEAWHLLVIVAALLLAIPVVAASVNFVSVWILTIASRHFLHDLRMALYRKILTLNMGFHSEHSSGALAGRLIDDIGMLHMIIGQGTLQIVVDVVVFTFAIFIALTISLPLTLMLLAAVSLYTFIYRYFSRKICVASASYRTLYDEITGRMQETVAGVRQVRIYNRESSESGQFLDRTGRSLDRAFEARTGSIGLSTVCAAVQQVATSVIVFAGAWMVLRQTLTYGDLFAFGSYMAFVFSPAVRMLDVAGQLEESMVSARRIVDILHEDPVVHDRPGAVDKPRGNGLIEFRDVHFGYTEDHLLYRGLNLRIEAGSSVAVVGPTGCGKTTLTALLMRHWDVHEGAIQIDGVELRDIPLRCLRRHFGLVLQDPVVFTGTFAENISYGLPKAKREDVERAARTAEIHDTIIGYPGGYDTLLGHYGIQLSRGERQRVSIARAILRDPEILIMDEATSALDSESEALIQKAMARVLKGRTSIVIAHRLSTIMRADQILVMRDGVVVAAGTHAQLLAIPDGLYRRLYEQLRSDQLETP
ncbi:MAG: ABC transporter ATP-binding protein [Verrucomicrobia bacterium]|nr:ABC transporter ATP-binding protein [Verrucomicrobiota bacterium]